MTKTKAFWRFLAVLLFRQSFLPSMRNQESLTAKTMIPCVRCVCILRYTSRRIYGSPSF
jgi:hypothetical protein